MEPPLAAGGVGAGGGGQQQPGQFKMLHRGLTHLHMAQPPQLTSRKHLFDDVQNHQKLPVRNKIVDSRFSPTAPQVQFRPAPSLFRPAPSLFGSSATWIHGWLAGFPPLWGDSRHPLTWHGPSHPNTHHQSLPPRTSQSPQTHLKACRQKASSGRS